MCSLLNICNTMYWTKSRRSCRYFFPLLFYNHYHMVYYIKPMWIKMSKVCAVNWDKLTSDDLFKTGDIAGL